jgi:hypothetical protein
VIASNYIIFGAITAKYIFYVPNNVFVQIRTPNTNPKTRQ